MSRYLRHIILDNIGESGQKKLSEAKVVVIGAGGLGCPVLQYLTAAGVGTIGIVDFDTVEESNLQRQILYGNSSIGINKAEAAKKRLCDLNHTITIIAYPEKLTTLNATTIFRQYDIIVDATDNLETRYLINDACVLTNKPMVYAGVYKFEGQVAVFNYQEGATYRCAFPETKNTTPNCEDIGVLGVLPGIIGTLQANEVLKIILEIGAVLRSKILFYNSLTNRFSIISLKRNEEAVKKAQCFKIKPVQPQQEVKQLSVEEALKIKDAFFVDVRNYGALPKVKLPNCITIPLAIIEKKIHEIPEEKEIIFFCQAGISSKKAVLTYQKLRKKTCYSMKAGIYEIKEHLEG